MRRARLFGAVATTGAIFLATSVTSRAQTLDAPVKWSFNGSIIEACSCPVFCQCFFNTQPAAHAGHHGSEHFCRFNVAYKVNSGDYGGTDLSGVKFWLAGDLGHDFSNFETDWAVLTFDPAVSAEQRAGISAILGKIYPLKWRSFSVGQDAPITWDHTESDARATLDGGRIGEIVLKPSNGMGGKPAVLQNIPYLGADGNTGLVIMPNVVEAYRIGEKAFEFSGTTGFTTTLTAASQPITD